MNPREPWNSFHAWLRERFGERVHRVSLDAGLTCPNRDGSKGRGGCLFCDASGSRAEYQDPALPIERQMLDGAGRMERRFGARRFIAYFQAYTNTYAPPERLERLWRAARVDDRVAALAVGTRPDCATPEALETLARVIRDVYGWGWLELGFLSRRQTILDAMNRREDAGDFARAARLARDLGIPVVAHVIFGLPGEPLAETAAAASLMNRLGVWGVKLHNLYIVADAPLAAAWRRGEAEPPGLDDYVRAVCDFLERLDPACLVHRLVGEARGDRLLAPDWARDKAGALEALRREFARRGSHQGALYTKNVSSVDLGAAQDGNSRTE